MEPSTQPRASTGAIEDEIKQLELSLPKELWFSTYPMYFYQGFWCIILEPTISFQRHFQALDTDIIIASIPKTGTTWLKSLLYAVANREKHLLSQSPVLSHNSHELILQLESIIYSDMKDPDLRSMPSPRLFGTHLPYPSLPASIKDSKSRIIYICRNPFDTFISMWHFYLNYDEQSTLKPDMDELFDKFCEGKFPFGPFEDHVLGYWKSSLERPEKVLFVWYEDLKKDPKSQLKKLAEFSGCRFSREEEEEGVIDEIIKLCSIESLKEVEANKNGKVYSFIENKWFFRKGEVGDWVNHMPQSMVVKYYKIMEEKFKDSGLSFK